jgi:hypothetical protein
MLPSNHLKIALQRLLRSPPLAFAPGELLVLLHFLDNPPLVHGRPSAPPVDVKKIIEATQICVREKDLYKQEVLAAVLQQLVDATPVPKLFMRSLIHTLTVHSILTVAYCSSMTQYTMLILIVISRSNELCNEFIITIGSSSSMGRSSVVGRFLSMC